MEIVELGFYRGKCNKSKIMHDYNLLDVEKIKFVNNQKKERDNRLKYSLRKFVRFYFYLYPHNVKK